MEDFILGLLMLNKFTAYEIHTAIRDNYEGLYSSSLGNVQRALKKLHEKGFVKLDEVHEGKVVKKIFSITLEGRTHFMTWLNNPLDLLKAKNSELGRLLLLGFLTKEQQLAKIDIAISEHKEAYEYTKAIEASLAAQVAEAEKRGTVREFQLEYYGEHKEYLDELLASVETDDYLELLSNVNKFGYLTLKLGMDEIKFTLDWFENLREELVAEMNE